MYKLPFIVILIITSLTFAQSPHGNNFDFDCEECHSTETWKLDLKKLDFDHSLTEFDLLGQHKILDCQDCHQTLVFTEVKNNCFECHTDIHQNTVSKNCDQCHNNNSWLINDINTIHEMSRFPLLGAHKIANCEDCHKSVNNLSFEQLGVECIDCHINDYQATTSPNHMDAGFSKNCEECHSVSDLQWRAGSVNHDFFPLTGGHNIGNCFDCHSQTTFEGLNPECITCHQSDFNATTDPNHVSNSFSTNCTDCHTTNPGWQPATFKDHDNFFQLLGAHKTIENDCAKCHTTGFANTPDQCYDCHKSDYEGTNNPAHQSAGFGTDCESCHNSTTWDDADFDHDNQFFPIYSGEHRGEWNDCSDCHTNSNDFQVFSCITCHEHNQSEMDSEHSGINGYFYESTACYACHPTGSEEGGFNHSTTEFPLTGSHTTTSCEDCHSAGFQGTSMECSACHQDNFNTASNPNHTEPGISLLCEDCHTTTAFTPSIFDHSSTGFELVGGHNLEQCSNCHSGSTANAVNECIACHQENYNSAPEHVSQSYPTTCEDCHNTTSWEETNFDHNSTNFALTGAHITTNCADCHTAGYAGTSNICNDCHNSDFTNTANPDHQQLGLETNCETCHTTNPGWQPATFTIHNEFYLIEGAHTAIANDCATCHEGNYNTQINGCVDCHQSDYNNTADPPHQSSGFDTNCEDCHSQNVWEPSTFDHDNQYFPIYSGSHNNEWNECSDCHTNSSSFGDFSCIDCHEHNQSDMDSEHSGVQGYQYNSLECYSCHPTGDEEGAFNHSTTDFQLIDSHANLECLSCHQDGFSNTSTECFVCHQESYNSAPEHLSQGYPTTCEDCHATTVWEESTFNHDNTNFALTGTHTTTVCEDCHSSGYTGTSTICNDCHNSDFNNAANPNHIDAGISTKCEDCHTTINFTSSTFNHSTTGFDLIGGHNLAQCSSCHSVSTSNADNQCYACHQANYNSAPEHTTQNYPTTCEDCHNTTNWEETTFDHNNTDFALTGAHTDVNCSNCHTSGYSGTSTVCSDCHISEYNSSSNPSHTNLGLSTSCESCHTTNSNWQPATFSVHNDFYVITGAHTSIANDCNTCHGGDYNNTPNTCYGCHQSDYNNTTDPAHATSGFSTDCEDCHSQNAWEPSTFDHDGQYFPIYSGTHRGEWSSCSDCHTNSSDFGVFSCIDCHEHNQTDTNNDHSEVNDYSYNSNACYDCHPNGDGDVVLLKILKSRPRILE